MKQHIKELRTHPTKRHSLRKFLIVLTIFIAYFIFVAWKFGVANGLLVSFLTRSFFVLCTPIADGGLLIDFPVRVATKIKMIHSEIIVWVIAISLNILAKIYQPEAYQSTVLLKLLDHIISQPWPYWSVILISSIGTFLSIHFGDELLAVAHHDERTSYHKHKHIYRILFLIAIIILLIILYYFLIHQLGITIIAH